ncbi:hypothetical protein [Vagococcus fluvialis]|uniref:hypothetical protein n=1 Tax=Vagococcus fluvialis TaxID=2738 RepID=UPI003D0BB8EB
MKKKFSEFAVKAGKTIITIISTQLINYISSEEFARKVKKLIQDSVSALVRLVLEEKNITSEKRTDL